VGCSRLQQAQRHEQLQHRCRLPSTHRPTRAGAAPQAAKCRRAQQAEPAAKPEQGRSTALAVCRGTGAGRQECNHLPCLPSSVWRRLQRRAQRQCRPP
jgi:hypothetical protein